MEVFKAVRSHSGLHPDSVGSLPVGGEFPFFGVLLVAPEDEIVNLKFSLYHSLAMSSNNLLLKRCFS